MDGFNSPPKEKKKRDYKKEYKRRRNPNAEIPKKVIDETGREILVYEGSQLVKDAKTGHIINSPNTTKITSSERAREVGNIRHERIRAMTRKEILKRTQQTNPEVKTEDEAFAFGAGETWQKAVLEGKYPRDRIEAVEKLGRLADFIPGMAAGREQTPANGLNIWANFDAESLLALADAFEKKAEEREAGIIDAKVIPENEHE
jgi:hypothetical protein